MSPNLTILKCDDLIIIKRKDHAGFYREEFITYENLLKQLSKDLDILEIK